MCFELTKHCLLPIRGEEWGVIKHSTQHMKNHEHFTELNNKQRETELLQCIGIDHFLSKEQLFP